MRSPLTPGTRIGGYRVGEVLGSGGMGVVYAAHDERLNRRVALKVMADHLAADPHFRSRFLREAAVLGHLDSPHIVRVHDHGEHEGHPWIATQLVDGGDLGSWIEEHGPLPAARATRICAQVSEALQDAHNRGIVHRDVKPANVLLFSPGSESVHAVVSDFGLAREVGTPLTAVRSATGTWDFLAPECGAGAPATPASDVYAVGCLLWTCLTGRPPYAGTEVEVALAHARQPPPTLPSRGPLRGEQARRLNAVIARAMHKDPEQRHTTAAELAAALREAGRDRPPRRRRTVAVASAVAALSVAGAVGYLLVRDTSGPDPASGGPVERPITGDLDADGMGDVAVLTRSDQTAVVTVSRAQGGSLSTPETLARVPVNNTLLRGDVDGDGTPEIVGLLGRTDGDYTVTVIPPDGSPVREQPLVASLRATSLYAVLGDFDGDGLDDLAVTTDVYDPVPGRIWVARSDGDGFGELSRWYAAEEPLDVAVPGDFDGDGTDDIALIRDSALELLTSDGTSFTGGDVQAQPQRLTTLAPGDFDGDGTDELAGVSDANDLLMVWSREDGRWRGERVSELDSTVPSSVQPGVADFDGDRRDDVLLVEGDYAGEQMEFRVALSTPDGFDPWATWLPYRRDPDDYFAVIGPGGG